MEPKKFYRSQTNSVIAGVCGGLAEYFDIDPVLVRVIFVLLLLFGGGGFLVYLILWIVIPKKPLQYNSSTFYQAQAAGPQAEAEGEAGMHNEEPPAEVKASRNKGGLIGGILLLTLGVLFLMDEFIPYLEFGRLWPVILIILGVILIVTTTQRNNK